MDEREQFLASQQRHSDSRLNDRQDAMERRAISQLLTAYGFKGSRRRVFKKGLTWFWTEQYPDMPLPFVARHIERWSFDDLFTRFTKSHVFAAWLDAADTYPDSDKVGVVFHAGRVGEMIMHNSVEVASGTEIIARYNDNAYTIRPYKRFLYWLVERWKPMGGPLEA